VGGAAELLGEDPGLDPRRARVGVDLDLAHPLGLDQDRVVERGEGERSVAGALCRHLQVAVGGKPDHL
jgi:hypothetical protein